MNIAGIDPQNPMTRRYMPTAKTTVPRHKKRWQGPVLDDG
jgi:hypothetical protein